MNDEILNNIWGDLNNDPEINVSDFNTWKTNLQNDPEVQSNVHE